MSIHVIFPDSGIGLRCFWGCRASTSNPLFTFTHPNHLARAASVESLSWTTATRQKSFRRRHRNVLVNQVLVSAAKRSFYEALNSSSPTLFVPVPTTSWNSVARGLSESRQAPVPAARRPDRRPTRNHLHLHLATLPVPTPSRRNTTQRKQIRS